MAEQVRAADLRAANLDVFRHMGHFLFALLASLVGGTVAVWLYTRRERAEAAAG
jgi:hypothetical protein